MMTNGPLQRILDRLYQVTLFEPKRSGHCWRARCPAHHDHCPSLSISLGEDGRVLLHCHAGCTQDEVIDALRNKGLWPSASRRQVIFDRRKVNEDIIRMHQLSLATELARATQGIPHSEKEIEQIKKSVRFLESYNRE